MAADRIVINRGKQAGNKYVRAAELVIELRNIVESLVATGNHCFTGEDFTLYESEFGMGAGKGANAGNLIGLIRGIFNTDDTISGVNRKAWLDEFCARVGNQ